MMRIGASFPMSGQALPPPTDALAIPVGLAAVSILAVLGMDAPKVQTTSVKLSEFGVFWARWSAIWAHCGRDCDERGNGGHLRGSLQVGENGRCADVGRIPSPVTSGNLARSPEAPKPRSPEAPKPQSPKAPKPV